MTILLSVFLARLLFHVFRTALFQKVFLLYHLIQLRAQNGIALYQYFLARIYQKYQQIVEMYQIFVMIVHIGYFQFR